MIQPACRPPSFRVIKSQTQESETIPTVTIEIIEPQLVEWVQRFSQAARQTALKVLIPEMDEFEALVDYGNQHIRELCAEFVVDWDTLTEEESERLIDDILHED